MSEERLHPAPHDEFALVNAGTQGMFEDTDVRLTAGCDLPSHEEIALWSARALHDRGIRIGRQCAARNAVVGDAVYRRSKVYHVFPVSDVQAAIDAMARFVGEKHGPGTVMPAGPIFTYLRKRADEHGKVAVRRRCVSAYVHDEPHVHEWHGSDHILLGGYYIHIPAGVL